METIIPNVDKNSKRLKNPLEKYEEICYNNVSKELVIQWQRFGQLVPHVGIWVLPTPKFTLGFFFEKLSKDRKIKK